MIDCHIHMVLDGDWWRTAIDRHSQGPEIPWIRQILARYQEAGFTWLRDGGDRWGVGAAARALAPEYGITYRTPLAPLCKEGHYGGFIGLTYGTLREYAQLVVSQKAQGADFIKIMISGLMDFDRFGRLTEDGLDDDIIRELVHIAHEEGMAVMAHGNGAKNVIAAARAGVDSIEHGAYLNEEALQAMKEAGTVWCPTLSTLGNLRGKGRFSETDVCAILDSALTNVASFGAMGSLIALGSDAGAWAVPHGYQKEEALLAQALGAKTQEILEKGNAVILKKF